MGDNGNEIKKDEQKTEGQQPLVQMIIIFDPNTGRIQVSGPINNRTLSYGMLEMAKEAIYDLKEKMQSKLITPEKHNILDFVRNRPK